jgi:hypothetical protein
MYSTHLCQKCVWGEGGGGASPVCLVDMAAVRNMGK